MTDVISAPEGELAREVARIGARLDEGLTPTSWWYTSPELLEAERRYVLGRSWQIVGSIADVAEPGQYFVAPIDALRSFIVVRDRDGVLHAFANVCPHRANPLLGGCGTAERIRCGYHAWTFDLDGTLTSVPSSRQFAPFEFSAYGLREVTVDTWGPFVFLNADPDAVPLLEHLGELPAILAGYGIDMAAIAMQNNTKRVVETIECNWKIAVENALECYHCATVHPSFRSTVDLPRWEIHVRGSCVVQGTRMRALTGGGQVDTEVMDRLVIEAAESGSDLAMFHWIFPNSSISFWPGPSNSFNYARWIPLGPHRCRWESTRWWSADVPDEVREAQWDFISEVGGEDLALIEGVQRGMLSGDWRGGVFGLSPDHADPHNEMIRDERGPLRLNRLVAETLLHSLAR
jgi:choline monooxygenase